MWSRKSKACSSCGRSDIDHVGHELCKTCYTKWYVSKPANRSRMTRTRKRYYSRHAAEYRERRQEWREQRHFNGLRDPVLDRDGHRCTKCGSTEKLVVHHLDGTGRASVSRANSMNDLTTLCRRCHVKVHRLLDGRWAWGYDKCIGCGRTDRRHNARGMCYECYRKWNRERMR